MMLKKLLALTICLLFLSTIANAWLAGYGYRKKITIQGGFLDANVTHFPLLIYIVDADIDDHCDDDGDRSFDIRFTQSDDSVLDVNWEDYSEAGGNATITAWVSDAGWTIQSDGSTEIYLYYGNAAAGDPGTDEGVWDSGFKFVHHMTDATASTILDSTSNDNDGTKQDGDDNPLEENGQIYKAQHGDGGVGHGIATGTANLSGATGTASFWMKLDAIDIWNGYFGMHESGASTTDYIRLSSDTDNKMRLLIEDGDAQKVNVFYDLDNLASPSGAWLYVVWTQDGTSMKCYIGEAGTIAAKALTEIIQSGNWWTDTFTISDSWVMIWEAAGTTIDGLMDEFRFSIGNRAVAWSKFEYHNMYEGDNELTWGGEEEPPADGYIPKVIIIR